MLYSLLNKFFIINYSTAVLESDEGNKDYFFYSFLNIIYYSQNFISEDKQLKDLSKLESLEKDTQCSKQDGRMVIYETRRIK